MINGWVLIFHFEMNKFIYVLIFLYLKWNEILNKLRSNYECRLKILFLLADVLLKTFLYQ